MRAPKAYFVRADSRRLPFPDAWFHACATSPPYFALRNYGDGDQRQVGVEQTPEAYVDNLVGVMGEVGRVLRPEGVLWVNLGDTYASGGGGGKPGSTSDRKGRRNLATQSQAQILSRQNVALSGIEGKELIGVPWMFALAMRRAGWMIRQEIIWAKGVSFCKTYAGSSMPNSVRDRCSTSHEHVFMFVRSPKYYSDHEAIRERKGDAPHDVMAKSRNARTVWTINTEAYRGGHYATWPSKLAAKLIAASTSEFGCCARCGRQLKRVVERVKLKRERPNDLTKRTGADGTGNFVPNTSDGTATRTLGFRYQCRCNAGDPVPARVLDCFGGVATTALAANRLGRDCAIVDLMHEYLVEGRGRVGGVGQKRNVDIRVATRVPDRVEAGLTPAAAGAATLECSLWDDMP